MVTLASETALSILRESRDSILTLDRATIERLAIDVELMGDGYLLAQLLQVWKGVSKWIWENQTLATEARRSRQ
jgi:hypothetical protein